MNEPSPSPPSRPDRTRGRMPRSVMIAIGGLVAILVVQALMTLLFGGSARAGWAAYAAFVLLFSLLIAGLVRRSRLAWLWSRYLSLVLGLVIGGTLLWHYRAGRVDGAQLGMALGGLALPLVVTGLALGRRSAYPYFDLVCPTCAVRTGLGEDLLFRKARCPTCGEVW